MGKGTDWMWVMEESDRELGTPAWLPSLKLEGILHRGRGEGDTSSLEEAGTLGGLRDGAGVDEDLGRRCRMEEKKEQDSGRGMVPIPLSNVRILQPKPAAQGEQLKWLREREGAQQERDDRGTMHSLIPAGQTSLQPLLTRLSRISITTNQPGARLMHRSSSIEVLHSHSISSFKICLDLKTNSYCENWKIHNLHIIHINP